MTDVRTPAEEETAATAADGGADPTGASDISYYKQSTFGRLLTVEAAQRAERARREALALTAVVLGLAAQSTLGNVIAGLVLLGIQPFRVGERVRLQGGTLGGVVEGTIASIGLVHTTIARGNSTLLVPNNSTLSATVVPL